MNKSRKKFTAKNKFEKLRISYPPASIKNVQATGEKFSHQKRTSSTSKHEIS
jgi:hypothetical protein